MPVDLCPSASHIKDSQPIKKAKALYDFEAKEANEVAFMAGEFISVIDDT
jgi:hypothetical protein